MNIPTLKISYKSKIILCYLLVVSIPYTIGLFYLYNSIVTSAQDNLMNTIESRMEQEQATIEDELKSIQSSAYFFSTNSLLNNFFTPRYFNDIQLVESINNTIMPIIAWMEFCTNDVGDFRFFTPLEIIPENEFFVHLDPYQDEPWMKSAVKQIAEKGYAYDSIHESRDFLYTKHQPGQVFSLFYQLTGTGLDTPTYLEIDILPKRLFTNLNTTPVMQDGFIICISDCGNEITQKLTPEVQSELLHNEELLSILSNSSANGFFNISSVRYYISTRRLPELSSTLVCMVPMENIVAPAAKTFLLFILIALSLTLLLFILSYSISSLLLRRIDKMRKAVYKMQTGDFDVHIPVNGHDEIDDLALSINTMSVKINDLINTVYKAEVKQKETEILALHSQINPHFLFNTLETFRMMAELSDVNQLADGIAMLGNLMRYNINIDKHLVTLQDEITIINDYVKIQNLLHNNRIILNLLIEPKFYSITMPNLILQPIIENNILHGLVDQMQSITIDVMVQEFSSYFLVSIRDNGIGVTKQKLESLRLKLNASYIEESGRRSIGLTNVNQRLILYFGSKSGLMIDSHFKEGFHVYFKIPHE